MRATSPRTIGLLLAGFTLGAVSVAAFFELSFVRDSRDLRHREAQLAAECESAIDADPNISKQKSLIEGASIVDLPTLLAVQGKVPSCVKYIRLLLSDPSRASQEQWQIDHTDLSSIKEALSIDDLSSIQSELSSIESELSQIEVDLRSR